MGVRVKSGWAVALCAVAGDAHASAWNPEPWSGEIISGYVQTTADTAVDPFGDAFALDLYSKQTSQTYAIVGVSDRIAVVGAFDYQKARIIAGDLGVGFEGPTKLEAGLQYQLHRDADRAVAVSASYLSGADLPGTLLTLEGRRPRVELRGLWGENYQLLGRDGFVEAQVAGRMELEGRFSGSRAQFSVGIKPFWRTEVIAKTRYVRQEAGTFGGFAIPAQQRWEAEALAAVRVWRQSFLEIGYQSTLAADNAVLEHGFRVGTWTKF